jgi:hypothetical protein
LENPMPTHGYPTLAYQNPMNAPSSTPLPKSLAAASSNPQIQRISQKLISIVEHLSPAARDDVEAIENAVLDYYAGRRHSLPSPIARPADRLHELVAGRHYRRMLRAALADATRLFAKVATR